MTNLKKLIGASVLVVVLGLTAFADCPVPGQMEGPPCIPAVQEAPDSTAPGQMDATPAVSEPPSVELPSLAEIALNVLMLF